VTPVAGDAPDPGGARRRSGYHHRRLHAVGGQVQPGQGAGVLDAGRAGAGAREAHGHRPRLAAQVGQGDSAAGGAQGA
jgi:hypothetical protein